jgi:hypothetical protein
LASQVSRGLSLWLLCACGFCIISPSFEALQALRPKKACSGFHTFTHECMNAQCAHTQAYSSCHTFIHECMDAQHEHTTEFCTACMHECTTHILVSTPCTHEYMTSATQFPTCKHECTQHTYCFNTVILHAWMHDVGTLVSRHTHTCVLVPGWSYMHTWIHCKRSLFCSRLFFWIHETIIWHGLCVPAAPDLVTTRQRAALVAVFHACVNREWFACTHAWSTM